MSPELLLGIAAVITALLGGGGITVLRRRREQPVESPSPGADARLATPALVELADALADATDDIRQVKARVAALEGSVWRCSVTDCPVRAQLHRGDV